MEKLGRLFISHASVDRDTAMHVVSFLEKRGIQCWISSRDIPASADWAEVIIDAVDSCPGMVLLVSRGSNSSPQVRREVERAVDRGIPLFPLILDRVRLSKWMQYYISAHQWNDASDVSLGTRLEELYTALESSLRFSESDVDVRFAEDLAGVVSELELMGSAGERLQPGERRNVAVVYLDAALVPSSSSSVPIPSSVKTAVSSTVSGLVEGYAGYYKGDYEQISLGGYRIVFGGDEAREDDGDRAFSCASQLEKKLGELHGVLSSRGLGLSWGLGLSAGYTVVDSASSAACDSVVLEAREIAEVHSSRILASGAFCSSWGSSRSWKKESSGYFSVAGKPPVPGAGSARSPFVGRETEMDVLCSAFSTVAAPVNGSSAPGEKHICVGVRGEAGIGKSRLMEEFLSRCCSRGCSVLRGQSLSFAQPSYWAWSSMLRELLDIAPGSSVSYTDFLSRLTSLCDYPVVSAPFLASLLSIDSGDPRVSELVGQSLSVEVCIAFRHLLEGLAASGPLAVVLEDAHWMEEGDRKILRFVTANCSTEFPVLFVLVHRPEDSDGSAVEFSFGSAPVDYSVIDLSEVDPSSCRSLAVMLLSSLDGNDGASVSPKAMSFLLDHSNGNPFFLEELVFDLVERELLVKVDSSWELNVPSDGIVVPGSLTGLLQSRLDRLPDSWKGVLQNSSVLGVEFMLSLYWKMLDKLFMGRCHTDVFDGLEEKKMLLGLLGDYDRKYLFRHILIHDAAYSTILSENLVKLHRAAAESIQELYPGETQRLSGMITHHYIRAGEDSEALSWGFKAMDQVFGREQLKLSYALEEILPRCYSGEELLDKTFRLLSYREQALLLLNRREEHRTVLDKMHFIADKSGSDYLKAVALKKRGVFLLYTGKPGDAVEDLERALALARRVDDRLFLGVVLGNLGGLLANQGKVNEATVYFEQALELHRETGDRRSEGVMTMNLGVMHKNRGKTGEAMECYEAALDIAREVGDRVTIGNLSFNMGSLLRSMGNLSEAEGRFRESIDFQREIGNKRSEAIALDNLGVLLMNRKKFPEAEACYEKAMEILQTIGDRLLEGTILGNYGVLFAKKGDDVKAAEYYKKALEYHESLGNKSQESRVINNLGGVYYRQGKKEKAEDCFLRSIAIDREIGNELNSGDVYSSLGLIYLDNGDLDRARIEYTRSYQAASDMNLGREGFSSFTELRERLLSSGVPESELPWPGHWED